MKRHGIVCMVSMGVVWACCAAGAVSRASAADPPAGGEQLYIRLLGTSG